MDPTTLFLLGGAAYAWWRQRVPPMTPEEAAPTIEVEPPPPDVAVPALTVHVVGESAAGKNDGLLLIAFPVTEAPPPASLSGRRFGAAPMPPPEAVARYRAQYRPSGPVRMVVPRPPPGRPAGAPPPPKPPKPTALHAVMPVAGAVLAAVPLVQLGAAKLRGQEVGVGQMLTATGATAVGIVSQFAPPAAAGGTRLAAHSVQYFSGNMDTASTIQYLSDVATDVLQIVEVAVPGLGFIRAGVTFLKAFSDMDGPQFGQRIGQGLGQLGGAIAGALGGPFAGIIVGLAAPIIGGKLGAHWDRRQAIARAKALEGITGASVDALLAEQWATWGEQQQAADAALAEQEAWWATPEATAAYSLYARDEADDAAAWNLPAPEAPIVDDAAAWQLPTPSDEVLMAALTDEELAALGLTPEEIDVFRHGAEEWTGGFGVPQPEDVVVGTVAEPVSVAELPWDERALRGEVPVGIKLLGAWDALITDSATVGAFGPTMFEWAARHCQPGSGATCRAVYVDGRTVDFFSDTVAMVPGAPLAVIEQYAA